MNHNNYESSMHQETMHDQLQVDQLQEELARRIRLYELEQLQSHVLQRQMLLLTTATRRTSSEDIQHILTSDSTYIPSTTQSTPVSLNVLTGGRSHCMNISWPQSSPTNHTHKHAQFNAHSLVPAYPPRTSDTLSGQGMGQSLLIPGRTIDDTVLSTPFTLHVQQYLPSGSTSSGTSNTVASATNAWSNLTPATPALLTNVNNPSLNTGPAPTMLGGGENRPCDTSTASTVEAQWLPLMTQSRPGEDSIGPMAPSIPDAAVITTTTPSSPPKPRRAAPSNYSTSTQNDSGPSSHPVLKRKSRQKDSEQKRRDLLKESFDELRLLLPSIELSLSTNSGPLEGLGLGEGEGDPPLPGAKPPRGPQRSDGEALNKGVSKLMLLKCGNKFIQDLIAQVGRRDEEVGTLREELKRLRATLGIVDSERDSERDLEKEDEEFREERRRARKKKRDEDREQASAKQRAA